MVTGQRSPKKFLAVDAIADVETAVAVVPAVFDKKKKRKDNRDGIRKSQTVGQFVW